MKCMKVVSRDDLNPSLGLSDIAKTLSIHAFNLTNTTLFDESCTEWKSNMTNVYAKFRTYFFLLKFSKKKNRIESYDVKNQKLICLVIKVQKKIICYKRVRFFYQRTELLR